MDIPDTITDLPVTSIGYHTFGNCSSLTSVTIGTNVTTIGESAFGRCRNLVSVTIPKSVTNIGDGAFNLCTSLTAITVDADNSFYSSVAGVLFDENQTTLIQCPGGTAGSYIVPDSVISIGSYAFDACQSLTNLTIGNSVTNIGDGAFIYCASLTAITVLAGNSIYSSVDGVLFDQNQATLIVCPGGKAGNYTISNTVTSIGDNAFYACRSLTSVTIPNSVTNIGDGAFNLCTSLTGVYFRGNAPSADSYVFYDDNSATVYYLPGTTGWDKWVSPPPAVLWNPQPQNPSVRTNQLGFTITGTPNIPIVVEACANLASPVWIWLQSCTLTNGSLNFIDPQPTTNCPARFYRLRSP